MNRKIAFIALSTLAVSAASAQSSLTGNTSSSRFTSISGTASNQRFLNGKKIAWGCGSTLEFIPKQFVGSVGQRFLLGNLEWCNASGIRGASTLNTNLNLGVAFDRGSSTNFNLGFHLDENASTGGRCQTKDCWTLPAATNLGRVEVNGQAYTLSLVGFDHTSGPGSISNGKWCTPNGTLDRIGVYGQLTPEAVPEPATMATLALGGLALVRRRRAAKK